MATDIVFLLICVFVFTFFLGEGNFERWWQLRNPGFGQFCCSGYPAAS